MSKHCKTIAHLKLDCTEAASDDENVPFVDGPVSFEEVGLQKYVKEVPRQAFDRVI